jgi:hypothetical protein
MIGNGSALWQLLNQDTYIYVTRGLEWDKTHQKVEKNALNKRTTDDPRHPIGQNVMLDIVPSSIGRAEHFCSVKQMIRFRRILRDELHPKNLANKFDALMVKSNLDRRLVAVVWLNLDPGNQCEGAFN